MDEPSSEEHLELRSRAEPLVVAALFLGVGVIVELIIGYWWIALPTTVFALLVATIAAWRRISPNSSLRLSPEGFSFGTLRRLSKYKWTDIDAFFTTELPEQRVGFAFAPSYRREPLLAWMDPPLHGTLLPDTYDMEPVELARLMESWRQRYARVHNN